ncbi:MAG TPA: Gfo/Idh/MocA family oxidoreductase [Chloroflexota bacterium]|nr:Gfo/Idh/MocA family oxidoreductase [Chloroflexota bacterium]
MDNDTIRIGFIGAGGIARQRHLPGLQKVAGVELVAVANQRLSSAEKVAKEYGFTRSTDDWEEVVDADDIDAVFIAAPPYLHRDATLAALETGKHVFCQARMARDYSEAWEMYEAARRTNLVTMVCPPPHALKGDYFVKKLLSDGYLGQLREVHVHSLQDAYVNPETPLHWRQDAFISGYNTLFLGMLVEVLHRWAGYFGQVTALKATHTPRRKKEGSVQEVAVGVADSLGIVGHMNNGAMAVFHFSGAVHFPGESRIELYGSKGTLIYYVSSNRILAAQAGEKELKPVEIPSDLIREWTAEADFISAIRTGAPVSPDFEEGLRYMEFTEAVYRSARLGQTVALPLEPES